MVILSERKFVITVISPRGCHLNFSLIIVETSRGKTQNDDSTLFHSDGVNSSATDNTLELVIFSRTEL